MIYTKQYPTQTVQGQLFGISQSKANLWIHYLLPKGSTLLQDTGFQGFSPADVLILQPAN
ncbi:transposase family protein [Desulfobacter latus]|uniref:Transposase family protein n=1 Tax=Desulfobacter latus TaxID=2292 RepID=A0A850TBH2_9BACT|nr:transposase family protein [Desulfobacter latus]